MGRGSRHSKNAGTMGSESQTAGERAALGYGTVKERLGKVLITAARLLLSVHGQLSVRVSHSSALPQEAIGNFYDCRISLKPAVVRLHICRTADLLLARKQKCVHHPS